MTAAPEQVDVLSTAREQVLERGVGLSEEQVLAVMDGHHRFQAAKRIGLSAVPAVLHDPGLDQRLGGGVPELLLAGVVAHHAGVRAFQDTRSIAHAADCAVSSRTVETMTTWSAACTAACQLEARMLLPVSTTIKR